MTFTTRCIRAISESGVDPLDGEAVIRALVEAGIRPDEVSMETLNLARIAVIDAQEQTERDAA